MVKDTKSSRKKYYLEHREEILSKQHKYNQDHREKKQIYMKKYRQEHRKERCAYRKSYQKNSQELLNNLKINGCAICGYYKCKAALEFHHVNSKDKKYLIRAKKITREDIIDEINKCILLCCRCHREIHHPKGGKVC